MSRTWKQHGRSVKRSIVSMDLLPICRSYLVAIFIYFTCKRPLTTSFGPGYINITQIRSNFDWNIVNIFGAKVVCSNVVTLLSWDLYSSGIRRAL